MSLLKQYISFFPYQRALYYVFSQADEWMQIIFFLIKSFKDARMLRAGEAKILMEAKGSCLF